jgi:arsenate reductase
MATESIHSSKKTPFYQSEQLLDKKVETEVLKTKKILLLCVANSARSQMAEGIAREIFKGQIEIVSAGSNPAAKVNPLAIRVLQEINIDISYHTPKKMDAIDLTNLYAIVTLCSEEACPAIRSDVLKIHWPIDDPAKENTVEAFRKARDIIIEKLYSLPEIIDGIVPMRL